MFSNIGICTLSFKTLQFLPYPFKDFNSYLILLNIGIPSFIFLNIDILTLCFQTLEFVPYPLKRCNSYLILLKILIPTLSF